MKKHLILIGALIFVLMLIPINTKAVTLKEYEDLVRKYENQLEEKRAEIKEHEKNIQLANDEIKRASAEITSLGLEIEQMQKDIVKYNNEIKEKSLQTKQLFKYLQVSNGENVYLEYIFGAEDITDLVYRTAIVEQISKYNEESIKELEEMIEANKKREIEIKAKQKQLETKKVSLNNRIATLTNSKSELGQVSLDIESERKYYQGIVNQYKNLGCKSNDVIGVDCAKMNSAVGYYRPTSTGYITANFGSYPSGEYHQGIDIGSSLGKSTVIYPVANGQVARVYVDNYGANVVVIYHYDASEGKYYTSLYAHLSKVNSNIYAGKQVTSDTPIGYMGNTGNVWPRPTPGNPNAGTHLHLELTPCRLYDLADANCSNWSRYEAYNKRLIANGYKGARNKIYFPNSLYVSWNSR